MGRRSSVAFAVGQLVFGVLLAELTVRAVYSWVPLSPTYFWSSGPASGALGYYYRGGGGIAASPQFVFDAEVGWVNRPGTYVQYGSTITVDELGLRATGAARARTATPRVLVYGDSFAFGADGDDAWWYGAELERRLPIDLVVAAVQSYGADQAWLRYVREGEDWQPDVVVLMLNSLMVARGMKDFELGPKPVVRAELGETVPLNVPLPTPPETLRQIGWSSHLKLTVDMLRWLRSTGFTDRVGPWRASGIAGAFADLAARRGHVPVVVWAPIPQDVLWAAHRQVPAPSLGGIRCPAGAICRDLTPDLVPFVTAGVPLSHGTHWSREVHERVAQVLAEMLAPPIRALTTGG